MVTVGPAFSVTAESSSQDELDRLIVDVRGNALRARMDWDLFDLFSFGSSADVKLSITLPALEAAEASSGADVEIAPFSASELRLESSSGADLNAQDVTVESIRLEASSGAGLSVEGTCGSVDAGASSGATVDARALVCRDAKLEVSSGASLRAHATQSVMAEASSGGSVDVVGNPSNVEREESSGGHITIGR